MSWVNWLGVALQVVGLLGAMLLLARLRETVTGHEVWLLHQVRAAWRWLRVHVLRRKPPTQYVHAQPAQVGVYAGRAHGVTTQGPIPAGLVVTDQVAWLDGYVRDVERKVNDLSSEVSRQASAQDDAVKSARDYAENQIGQAVEDVRSEVRQLVGKDVGWEVVSLALVAVGVVLAAV
jgi:tetrahydromethanopterin S-methyltransferase subunit G